MEAKHKNKKFCKECAKSRKNKENRESSRRVREDQGKVLGNIIKCETCGCEMERDHPRRKYCSYECKMGQDGLFHVYILPEIHYAGMTTSIKWRLATHKRQKSITKMEVLASYDCPKKAHLHETQLHVEGYEGFFVERSYL